MRNKLFLVLGLILILLAIILFRSCVASDDQTLAHNVSKRYLVCRNCPAQYQIPADYFAKISPADMHRDGPVVHFRCRECGEIAAEPGMIIMIGGEVVSISGVEYDQGRGLDEM